MTDNTQEDGRLAEDIALVLINSDRRASGWPEADSRESIPDSNGYILNAHALIASFPALSRTPPPAGDVEAMTQAFLQWRLPENFSPDAGITFEPEYNVEYNKSIGKPPMRHEPVGTNLLSYEQAKAMVEHLLTATRPAAMPDVVEAAREAFKAGWRTNVVGEDVQPASYLDGCEQTDWEEYQRKGIGS